jgi:hypothetical protein
VLLEGEVGPACTGPLRGVDAVEDAKPRPVVHKHWHGVSRSLHSERPASVLAGLTFCFGLGLDTEFADQRALATPYDFGT